MSDSKTLARLLPARRPSRYPMARTPQEALTMPAPRTPDADRLWLTLAYALKV